MIRFIFALVMLMNIQLVIAAPRYVTTYSQNPNQYCSFAGQNRNISRLENRVFNRTYNYDTPEERISRLERQMFGATQSGDLKTRLAKVKRASSHMNKPVYDYSGYDNYYTPPIAAGSGWKSIMHSFGNYMMGGVPTGITPQMDPAYMDYFEAQREAMKFNDGGNYRDVRTNHGWRRHNVRRGSSTGVTIID